MASVKTIAGGYIKLSLDSPDGDGASWLVLPLRDVPAVAAELLAAWSAQAGMPALDHVAEVEQKVNDASGALVDIYTSLLLRKNGEAERAWQEAMEAITRAVRVLEWQ